MSISETRRGDTDALSELRSLLHSEPSASTFGRVMRALEQMSRAELQRAEPYAASLLARWPHRFRYARDHWIDDIREGSRRRRHAVVGGLILPLYDDADRRWVRGLRAPEWSGLRALALRAISPIALGPRHLDDLCGAPWFGELESLDLHHVGARARCSFTWGLARSLRTLTLTPSPSPSTLRGVGDIDTLRALRIEMPRLEDLDASAAAITRAIGLACRGRALSGLALFKSTDWRPSRPDERRLIAEQNLIHEIVSGLTDVPRLDLSGCELHAREARTVATWASSVASPTLIVSDSPEAQVVRKLRGRRFERLGIYGSSGAWRGAPAARELWLRRPSGRLCERAWVDLFVNARWPRLALELDDLESARILRAYDEEPLARIEHLQIEAALDGRLAHVLRRCDPRALEVLELVDTSNAWSPDRPNERAAVGPALDFIASATNINVLYLEALPLEAAEIRALPGRLALENLTVLSLRITDGAASLEAALELISDERLSRVSALRIIPGVDATERDVARLRSARPFDHLSRARLFVQELQDPPEGLTHPDSERNVRWIQGRELAMSSPDIRPIFE